MKNIGIIPARMASTRFPDKPLKEICGIPMIGHVYFRAKMCKALDEVFVATCDKEIEDYAISIGAKALITSDTHERASDRCAEALEKIEAAVNGKLEIIAMIQGDEPMIYPEMIDSAVEPLIKSREINVANLMSKLHTIEEFEDPNEVKVVADLNNFALYYSREPIPSLKRGAKSIAMQKQLGIIVFRRDYLFKFNKLPPTPLEIAESVDMMRILEHGEKVKMVLTDFKTWSVDTPEDLVFLNDKMKIDKLYSKYGKK